MKKKVTAHSKSKTHQGFLLIADITGYSKYLSETELIHSQETLTAILRLLVDNTQFPLIISRLEGDAVISYGLQENFFLGQTFIEMIEKLYVTFRKAIDRLVLNNTCRCKACANISNLDLKFIVHQGVFGFQQINDHQELVGNDINLVHKLLKNSVKELYDLKGYALYTEKVIQHLGLEAIADSMIQHIEMVEYLGDVTVYIQDLHPIWKNKSKETRVKFPENQIIDQSDVIIKIPRERLWDYLTQPEFRNTLIGSNSMELSKREQGRIAPGSIYQCYHGDKWVPHIILEWQVFERIITRESNPIFPNLTSLVEYQLEDTGGGTRLTRSFTGPIGSFFGGILYKLMLPFFKRYSRQASISFKEEIEQDYHSDIKKSQNLNGFVVQEIDPQEELDT
jgi:uncharacterized protein YndB with AHSA1/START domain